ncbi:MAG: hypothetical protein AAFU68_02965 [Pseudomonadota bacterium]
MRYRKKPVVIEAMRVPSVFHIDARCAFEDWINPIKGDRTVKWRGKGLVVETLEGDMAAQPGDWIIRGVKGELYPCKPDIFEATYEPVEEPTG